LVGQVVAVAAETDRLFSIRAVKDEIMTGCVLKGGGEDSVRPKSSATVLQLGMPLKGKFNLQEDFATFLTSTWKILHCLCDPGLVSLATPLAQ